MKILMVGAGALCGYFGGRLLAAGRDVTFLVRPGRAKRLAESGLRIDSPAGNLSLPNPPTVSASELKERYDLVVVGCKAYDLDACMEDIAPAIGPDSLILPFLNGLAHIDRLATRFSRANVLGGRCFIFAALDSEGQIIHQAPTHRIDFGELDGGESERARAVLEVLSGAGFDATLNPDILTGMWEKWVLISTVAGATCLMRATIGDIVRSGGRDAVSLALLAECTAVAEANGRRPAAAFLEQIAASLSDPDSPNSASTHKDMEKGGRIESDHIIGDLLSRITSGRESGFPILQLVFRHMKAYEARREREGWQ